MKKKSWIIIFMLGIIVLCNMAFTSDTFTHAELMNIEVLSTSDSSTEIVRQGCYGEGSILCGKTYHKARLTIY